MCLAQSETLLTIPEVREEQLIVKKKLYGTFFGIDLEFWWFSLLSDRFVIRPRMRHACSSPVKYLHVERNSLVMNDNLLLGRETFIN